VSINPVEIAPRTSADPAKKSYRRMTPADRRRQIIDAAVVYFAEVGFDGATRALAERLGVTQPLIYRYFPSKDELIKAVYDEVYIGRWREEWLDAIKRRDVPLRDRLIDFYERYTDVIFQPEWMRIYLFSGLRGLGMNRWWIAFLEEHVLLRICAEIRHGLGLPSPDLVPIQPAELEIYWLFHGGVFYYGMRKHMYGVSPHLPLREFLEVSIDSFLDGFPAAVQAAVGDGAGRHGPA
jgi:AcrR family transcriptional regulator